MGIYSLNNAFYLWGDIEDILNRIDEFYIINSHKAEIVVESKISLDKKYYWASEEGQKFFNSYIPKFKSLHKDMYALIEAIERENKGDFNIKNLSLKYPLFDKFRLLNNQIKHFETKLWHIDLVGTYFLDGVNQIMEVGCQFQKDGNLDFIIYKDFIKLFLSILSDYKLISLAE